MKIKYIILGIILSILVGYNVSAIEDVDCEEYYKFQNGMKFEDFHSDKVSYSPGDEVILSYNLVSKMDIPVVEGRIRVQILYNDPKQGEQIVDEFFAKKNLNLMPNDILEQEIKWTVPDKAKSGEYQAKVYFLVKDFNLAGLSFVPYAVGVPGDMTSFEVKNSGEESRIYWDKDATKVNGKDYPFNSFLLSRESEPLQIETKVVNEGKPKEVKLKLMTYEWDDVSGEPIQEYTVEKTLSLEENGEKDVEYELPALNPSTYEIRFLAQHEEEKSILKLRIPIQGAKGRFLYLALDKFPLKAGEKTKIFFCLSNSADYVTNFNGSGRVELLDSKGETIFKEEYSPLEVIPDPKGKVIEFTPQKDYSNLVLKADLTDKEGDIHDEVSLKYDYSKFSIIPAQLNLELGKKKLRPEEKLSYSLNYEDGEGRELTGRILLYLLDDEGAILKMIEKEISGSLTEEMELPSQLGTYTLVARELTHDLKTERELEIVKKVVTTTITTTTIKPTTTLPKWKPTQELNYLIWTLVGIGVVYLIVYFSRREK